MPAPRHTALVLNAVECTRTGACTAAGAYLARNKPNLPFAVSRPRAGAAWRFRILPAPFPTTRAALKARKDFNLIISSISCVRADACTVVGNYEHVVNPDKDRVPLFTEAWDGRHWRLLPVPKLRRQPQFASVTCWAPTSCLAAGNTGLLLAGKPVALRRSGSRWSVATAPVSALAFGEQALWCASATSCLAVGAGTGGADQASRLHGTTWTALTMPSPAGTSGAFLSDVACTLAGRCAAVGGFNSATGRGRTLIESGGPGGWSASPAPSPAGVFDSELGSVACPAANFCLALGHTLKAQNAGFPKAFSEAWNGSAWRIVATVDPGTSGATLADVSCESATDCVAVGYAQVDGVTRRQLIEQWDGSGWKIVTGARLAGATDSELDSVSCSSRTFCVAIGIAEIGGAQQSIAERFGGHAWTPLSHAGLLAVDLAGLSCISPTFCMAAGETADQSHPLAQEWNGSAWKTAVVPSPSPLGDEGATLSDVSCTSETACTAIGGNDFDVFDPSQEGPRPTGRPFAETWNGTDWSAGSLDAPGGTISNTLSAISCAALSQCWAAGLTERIETNVPLIEHRSG